MPELNAGVVKGGGRSFSNSLTKMMRKVPTAKGWEYQRIIKGKKSVVKTLYGYETI